MKRVTNLNKCFLIIALGLTALVGAAQAATVTVTVVDDGVSNIGSPGTFYWALTNCNANDTIAFNIAGAGPHYLQVPPGGFPLIYRKHHLLIDGYTQPGASPNTQSITQANNAVIKIVVDARNGNSRGMDYGTFDGTLATSDPPIDNTSMALGGERTGYGNDERALLGIYRSTNVTIRGLAFLSTWTADANGNQKGICLAHDYGLNTNVLAATAYTEGSDANCHINGCWFGVDPTNQTVAAIASGPMAIAAYRHRDASGFPRPELPNYNLTVGVKKGSANPRAEFNVFVGYGYVIDSENLRTRFSGNFVDVMPDGVTPVNTPELNPLVAAVGGGMIEWGRYSDTEPVIIGTDGDGVNDAEEGNLFGPQANLNNRRSVLDFYSTSRKAYIIAGNRFGIGVDGTRWTNNSYFIFGGLGLSGGTQVRFGSDFNGVSDTLEGNIVYNNHVFSELFPSPNVADVVESSLFRGMESASVQRDAWVSVRGNSFVGSWPAFNPDDSSSALNFTNWWAIYANGITDNPTSAIPVLSATSTATTLSGTFAPPSTNGYNTLILDVYLPDPESQTNGALFDLPTFGGSSGWGFVLGKTYLGSFKIANPASGAFSVDISSLGLAPGTKVTAAITYSTFAQPNITSISRSGTSTTLSWTGSNGGPYPNAGQGAPSSGFGVLRSSNITGPWTTLSYAADNSITVSDSGGTSFYRIQGPVSGMTTLFAPPVTLL